MTAHFPNLLQALKKVTVLNYIYGPKQIQSNFKQLITSCHVVKTNASQFYNYVLRYY